MLSLQIRVKERKPDVSLDKVICALDPPCFANQFPVVRVAP